MDPIQIDLAARPCPEYAEHLATGRYADVSFLGPWSDAR